MKKTINHVILLFSLSTLSLTPNAKEISKEYSRWYHPIVSLTVGHSFADVGSSEQEALQVSGNISTYTYNSNRSHSNRLSLALFLGTEFSINKKIDMQLGGEFSDSGSYFAGPGSFTQGVDLPSSDTYTYNYRIKNQMASLHTKIMMQVQESFHPFVLMGLGLSANKTYGYTTSVPYFLSFTPLFSNKTNYTFSYLFGAGVDVDYNKNIRIGFGYRYSDLGKANLGSAMIDSTPFNRTLPSTHLVTHQYTVQLTYLLPEGNKV